MLKLIKYINQNSLNKLDIILNKRKFTQKNETTTVKKIISNVKKRGDKAVIEYEKKFSKTLSKSNKLIFSKK